MSNPSMTLVAAAAMMAEAFVTDTRTSGEPFVKLRGGSPQWMTDAVLACHDDGAMLPDDVRYSMVQDVACAIAEYDAEASDDDVLEWLHDEGLEGLVPYATADLTAWLATSPRRVYYLSDAIDEYGDGLDGFQALSMAYLLELRDVAASLTTYLQSRQTTD